MPRPRKPIEQEDIVEDILALAEEMDRTPTAADFRERIEEYSFRLIQQRFGTWNEAVEAAGLEPNPGGRIPA